MIDIENIKQKICEKYKDNNMSFHMPYICYTKTNIPIFLFDVKINGYWKIFVSYKDILKQIPFYNKQTINQCNPFIRCQNNEYKFYYTKNQYFQNKMTFISYTLKNLLFNQNSFINEQQIYSQGINVYYIDNNTDIKLSYSDNSFVMNYNIYKVADNYYITCIRPVYNTNNILFTLAARDKYDLSNVCSILYNKDTQQFKYIHLLNSDNYSIYKCSIDPKTADLYFAKRIGQSFNDRTIQVSTKDNYQFLNTNIIFKQ